MSINRIHRKKQNFSILSNEPAQNKDLSLSAKGILWFLLTKPDGWEVRTQHLINYLPDGERSIKSALKNLEEQGYLIRWCDRGDRGRLTWRSEIFESLEDAENWCKQNSNTIQSAIRLSKGTAISLGVENDPPCIQKPIMVEPCDGQPCDGQPCDGQPCDGQPCDGKRQVLVNTEESITDLNSSPYSPPSGKEESEGKELETDPEPITSLRSDGHNDRLIQPNRIGEDKLSAAPQNFESAAARFERQMSGNLYPWQGSDRKPLPEFVAFVAKQLPQSAQGDMNPNLKAKLYIQNRQREDQGIEKLECYWETFQEAKARAEQTRSLIPPKPVADKDEDLKPIYERSPEERQAISAMLHEAHRKLAAYNAAKQQQPRIKMFAQAGA